MLKLENRKDPIPSLSHFIIRLLRFGLFCLLLIIFSLAIGVFGYHYFGKTGWLDSFHMSSMILAGMGPVVDLKTHGGKLFSSFYALYSGIAFLSINAFFFAPIIHRIFHILHFENKDESS